MPGGCVMPFRVRDILAFHELPGIRAVVSQGLDRQVRWVHPWPEVLPWLHGGELLLTTAYSWPPDPREQRRIVRELCQAGVAGILFRTGGFFPGIPPAVVEEARSQGLAILEAGEDVSFVDLTETLNREILRRHFEALERSDRVHRALTEAALEAESVADILRRFSELTGRQASLVDRHGHLLAGEEGFEEFLRTRPDPLKTPTGPVRLTDDTWILCVPVRTGTDTRAHLILVSRGESPSDADVRAAEHAALVIGLHLLRQQAMAEAENRVRNTFVEAVLQGRLERDPALQERARLLGFDPHGTYLVAAAVPVGPNGRADVRALDSTEDFQVRSHVGEALRHALRTLEFPEFVAFELNHVLAILPAHEPPGRLRTRVEALYTLLRAQADDIPLALSLGRPYTGYAALRHSLEEARATLSVVRGPGIYWFEDALLLRILHSVADRDALRALYDATLGRLHRASPALYDTARALVACGFNQRAAARVLKAHWNTLRHRIARIEQLLGASLSDPELRLRLQLACVLETIIPNLQFSGRDPGPEP